MIFYLTTQAFRPSVLQLEQEDRAPSVTVLTYEELFSEGSGQRGTYIFSNTEALSPDGLSEAARFFRRLEEHGCRVLNDPARVRGRFSLLRALYQAGQNPFNVYPVEEGVKPKQFPVFLRIEHTHNSGSLTNLILDQAALDEAVEAAICAGFPRALLLIVEYAAQPISDGVFAKGSVYKIGDRFVPDIWWYGKSWCVTGDRDGLVGEDAYSDELRMMQENSFAEDVAKSFALANIDYGRVDFGLIGDSVCIYEINTSPSLYGPRNHPTPQRVESLNLRWSKLLSAFHEIDTKSDDLQERIDLSGTSIKALTKAQMLSQSLPLSMTLSEEHRRRGNSTEALQHARGAVTADPNSLKAQTNLSRVLTDRGSVDDAICILEKVLETSPRSIFRRHQLVDLLLKAGRLEEAHSRLIESFAIEEHWRTNLLLGIVRKKLGDQSAAQEAIRRAIDLATTGPADIDRLATLAHQLSKGGFVDDAISVLSLLVEANPGSTRERRRLANLLLKMRRPEEARDHLIDALAIDDAWETNLLLSRAYKDLGDMSAAFDVASHAADLAPQQPKAIEWLRQLNRDRLIPSSRLKNFLHRMGVRRA